MTLAVDEKVEAICAHCGLDVPAGLIDPQAQEQFCCAGCRMVYQTISGCGLDQFYRLRQAAKLPANPSGSAFQSFDAPAFHKLYVRDISEQTSTTDLVLEGVTCAACVWLIERLPNVLPGVIEARLSLRLATVRITWDKRKLNLSRIARLLDNMGYTPHAAKGASRKQIYRNDLRNRMVHLAVAGAIAGNAMLVAFALYAARGQAMDEAYRQLFRWVSLLLGGISLAWPGSTFYRAAMTSLRMRRITLDVPIALALSIGALAGTINVVLGRGDVYFDSLSVLVFLLLIGRLLQFRQQRGADSAVELLLSLTPSTCRLVRGNEVIEEVPPEALVAGDLIEVRSGETIGADGIVETGESAVMQAILTGESLPTSVGPGAEVFAGAHNQGAAIRVRVSHVGAESRMGRLMRIVEQGIGEKPKIVEFADRVSGWFVLIVSVAAMATLAYWSRFGMGRAIDHAVALLIVSCPCVLGMATPITLAMAIGRLARGDILVKSAAALETLAKRGRISFDKTGTLTEGRLAVAHWFGPENLKPLVAALEAHSDHPVARALSGGLSKGIIRAIDFQHVTNNCHGGIKGIYDRHCLSVGSPTFCEAEGIPIPNNIRARCNALEKAGMTTVLVAMDGQCAACAALADPIRLDSPQAVAELKRLGWDVRILSGDAGAVVDSVARKMGIDSAQATGTLLPEDKLDVMRKGRGAGPQVMVGDGVNDAAALGAADVGIAVRGGAEVALSAADVYIASPGVAPLVHLIRAARRTMNTIRLNLCISLAYNLVAGTFAAMGKMNPLIAAILMPMGSATALSVASLATRHILPAKREDRR